MNILVIVNTPVDENGDVLCATGYGKIANDLNAGLRRRGVHVKTVGLEQLALERFPDKYGPEDDLPWEYKYVDDEDLADILIKLGEGFESVLVHDSCLLPMKFAEYVGSRCTRIVHDPSFADPLYGMVEGRLRRDYDWSKECLLEPRHQLRVRKYLSTIIGTTVSPDFSLARLHAAASHQWDLAGKVVFPSTELKHAMHFARISVNTRCTVIPHFDTFAKAPQKSKGVGILINAAWGKMDIPLIMTFLQRVRHVPIFVLTGTKTYDTYFKVFSDYYGFSDNINFVDSMEPESFHEFCMQNIGLCFHPSIIMETFGLLPYEMAAMGIPTILGHDAFSGLRTAIRRLNLEAFSISQFDSSALAEVSKIIEKHSTRISTYEPRIVLGDVDSYIEALYNV